MLDREWRDLYNIDEKEDLSPLGTWLVGETHKRKRIQKQNRRSARNCRPFLYMLGF
jgi:hypothetical protein